MKSTFAKLIGLFLYFVLVFATFGQDENSALPEDAVPVIADNAIPEAAPLLIDATVPEVNKDSVRVRLKRIENEIPLTYNNTINSFISYFVVRNREYSKMVLRRKEAYFPVFERILKENNMPDELKYLSIVESGLNPRARSRAGAVGLWQFVPGTGKYYKLNIDWYIDERSDPEKSTKAACEYLRYLHTMFNNWELALAAYNCGPGNVRKAIRNARNKRDFWEIYYYLPRETRSYVPQFVAISYLMNYHKEHNIVPEYNESIYNPFTIYTDQYINVETLAKNIDLCPEDLQRMNPTLLRNRVPSYLKNFPLKIPMEKVHLLMANYCAIMDSCSKVGSEEILEDINPNSEKDKNRSVITHVVKKGEILQKVAAKYHVTSKEIKTWNQLKGTNLKYGQKLTIWRDGTQKNSDKRTVASNIKSSSKRTFKSRNDTYKVKQGDTLWSICQKLDVSLKVLKRINKLRNNEVRPGQKLILS